MNTKIKKLTQVPTQEGASAIYTNNKHWRKSGLDEMGMLSFTPHLDLAAEVGSTGGGLALGVWRITQF